MDIRYTVRINGIVINDFETLNEAFDYIERLEEEDRQNGDYEPNFYEVYDNAKEEIVF